MCLTCVFIRRQQIQNLLIEIFLFFLEQIECSSISDYAVKIVKANKLDDGVYIT